MNQEDTKVILVVDDMRLFLFEGAHYARSCEEGIEFIVKHEHIHQIWLDYNLGPAGTINKLLEWLQQECQRGNKPHIDEVYIHTNNDSAAQFMKKVLDHWFFARIVDPQPHIDFMTMMREQVI